MWTFDPFIQTTAISIYIIPMIVLLADGIFRRPSGFRVFFLHLDINHKNISYLFRGLLVQVLRWTFELTRRHDAFQMMAGSHDMWKDLGKSLILKLER